MYTTPYSTTNNGIFTTFVDNIQSVNNYPVPVGGMAILIDLNGSKMYFKSVNANGVPAPVRVFNIKEIPQVPPANPNMVTRQEFDALNQKIDKLLKAMETTTNAT